MKDNLSDIKLTNPLVFKTIFSKKNNHDILTDLLGTIIGINFNDRDIEIIPSSIYRIGFESSFIVRVKPNVVIEIELFNEPKYDYDKRIVNLMLKKQFEDDLNFKKTKFYYVSLFNFIIYQDTETFIHKSIFENNSRDVAIRIELPKVFDINNRIKSWIYVILHGFDNYSKVLFNDDIFLKLYLNLISLSKNEEFKKVRLRKKYELDKVIQVLSSCHKTSLNITKQKNLLGKEVLSKMFNNDEPIADILLLMDVYGFTYLETFSLALDLNNSGININKSNLIS